MNAATLIGWLVAILLAVAALHDVAVRTVPNAMSAALTGCGLLMATLQGRLLSSLAITVLLLAVSAFLWARGYIGGADAKLLAAAGLLVSPGSVPTMLLATALTGGVLCLPYLYGHHLVGSPASRRPAGLIPRLLRCERWRLRRRGPLPYAVAIATGTLFALLYGA